MAAFQSIVLGLCALAMIAHGARPAEPRGRTTDVAVIHSGERSATPMFMVSTRKPPVKRCAGVFE